MRTLSVISWVALCLVLPAGRAAAQDKDQNAEAQMFWEQLLTKCGESYFYNGDQFAGLQEFRDASFTVTPRSLTEADKLNGIRWAGMFTLQAKAYRDQSKFSKRWSKWKDGGRLELKAENVEGKWSVFGRRFVFQWVPVTIEKASCDLLTK